MHSSETQHSPCCARQKARVCAPGKGGSGPGGGSVATFGGNKKRIRQVHGSTSKSERVLNQGMLRPDAAVQWAPAVPLPLGPAHLHGRDRIEGQPGHQTAHGQEAADALEPARRPLAGPNPGGRARAGACRTSSNAGTRALSPLAPRPPDHPAVCSTFTRQPAPLQKSDSYKLRKQNCD